MSTQVKKNSEIDLELAKIKRGTVEILPEKELLQKLEKSHKCNQPLIIKVGYDPTAADLHLGHLVLLRKMRQLQELGHEIHFLIGDFTAMIGDPSGRSQTRQPISQAEIEANTKTYHSQVLRILDEKKTKICFNSSWCQKMSFEEVLALTARYTVARLLERDDFSQRYKKGTSISLIEFIYPLIQGYDSVVMKADVELGGNDQKFNLLVGRELQVQYGLEPQVIITLPLLVGLDGKRKMSKSYNNYIGINETPYSIFAKCMSISDELMWDYFTMLTDIPPQKIEQMRADTQEQKTKPTNPMEFKKLLGCLIVNDLHGNGAGEEAQRQWEKEKGIASRSQMVLPPNVTQYIVSKDKTSLALVDIIIAAGLEKSKSSTRRLIESGAIKLGKDLEVIKDVNHYLQFPGRHILKIGKKRYLEVRSK